MVKIEFGIKTLLPFVTCGRWNYTSTFCCWDHIILNLTLSTWLNIYGRKTKCSAPSHWILSNGLCYMDKTHIVWSKNRHCLNPARPRIHFLPLWQMVILTNATSSVYAMNYARSYVFLCLYVNFLWVCFQPNIRQGCTTGTRSSYCSSQLINPKGYGYHSPLLGHN